VTRRTGYSTRPGWVPGDTDPGITRGRLYAPPAAGWLGLVTLAVALALALAVTATPTPLGANAPADRFAEGRAVPLLERLFADGAPHPIGTEANAAMRERVIGELEALGLDVTTQTRLACMERFAVCGEVTNVLARLPGQVDGPAVLLTAHYDSVGAGPGVSDDMVGVVAVIETVRSLQADGPTRNPFIVLLTDGEEVGLLGAEAFTHHPWFDEVGVVINVEARGTRGQSLMFETNDGNAWLVDAFAKHAPRPVTNSLFYDIYRTLPNDTDFSVYKAAGLNGLNFAYADEVAHYHTPLDDLEHLDRGSLQHQGDNVLAAARALGAADLTDQPPGNSLFIDLVPGSVLRVPESWAVPLAAACLLAWLFITAVLSRRGAVTLPRVLLGVLGAVLAVAVAGALGFGVSSAVQALTGLNEPWYASPLATRVAVWLAALFGVLATSAVFSRVLGFWGTAIGAWLVWALLTLAAALTLPGASVVLLMPTVVASALYLVVVAGGAGRPGIRTTVGAISVLAAALATFAAAYLWLPLALSVESLMGMLLSAAVAVSLALAFITVTPLLAVGPGVAGSRSRSARGVALVACVLGIAAGVALATRAPTFSELRPQRFSIRHLVTATDGDLVDARWVLDRYPDAPLQEGFGQWTFEPVTVDLVPFVGSSPISTPAASPLAGTVQPPRVEVLSDETDGTTRVLGLRLLAGDPFERLTLTVPRSVGAARLVVPAGGVEIQLIDGEPRGGHATFMCHGAACDGLELELHLGVPDALELGVTAQRSGLPDDAAGLVAARPATAVPSQDGDVSMVLNVVNVQESVGF